MAEEPHRSVGRNPRLESRLDQLESRLLNRPLGRIWAGFTTIFLEFSSGDGPAPVLSGNLFTYPEPLRIREAISYPLA